MKKLLCLLAVLLCLTGASRAETLFAPESGDAFRTLCASGDTLRVRGSRETVYRVDARTGESTLLTLPEENEADENGLYHAWAGWFCHEGQLCALRIATEPGAGVAEVELCRLTESDGLLVPESATPLDSSAFAGWEAFSVEGSCVVGDTLCLNIYDGRSEVYLIPLDGSDVTATGLQDARFCPYQNGLLCAIPDEAGGRGYTLLLVDPSSGDTQRLASLDEGMLSGLAQEPGTNRLLFVRNGALWAFDPDAAQLEKLAPLPLAPVERGEGLSACVLENGLYAALGENGLLLQRPAPQETARLVIAEQEETAAVDQAALAFASSLSVERVPASRVLDALLTRSAVPDVFILRSAGGSEDVLAAILDRGYALPLESDALQSFAAQLYPALSDALTREGTLLALPLTAEASGLGVNLNALTRLGLEQAQLPADWGAFLDFFKAQAGQGVPLVPADEDELLHFRLSLLEQLFADYEAAMRAGGEEPCYDSPLLRSLLEKMEAIDWQALAEEAAESGDVPLFDCPVSFRVSESVYAEDYDYYPLPLALDEAHPAQLSLICCAALINPSTEHPQEALSFLEACVQAIDPADRAMLCPGAGEPLRDQAQYDETAAFYDAAIEKLRQAIEETDGDPQDLKDKLARYEALRAQAEDSCWIISPQSIAAYRALTDGLSLQTGGELAEIDLSSLLTRYLEGATSLDSLLTEVEKKAALRRAE